MDLLGIAVLKSDFATWEKELLSESERATFCDYSKTLYAEPNVREQYYLTYTK